MNIRLPVTAVSMLIMIVNPITALAQDETAEVEEQSPPLYSAVELGVGYSNDDAYRFGRYNGLEDEGPYLLGDVDAWSYSEDGRFWRARGTNLGLDSRYLRLEAGRQGQQQYFIEYDRLPNYETDTARTPFRGVGQDTLTLPTGFDINTNLNSSLLPFDIETRRERIGLGGRFIPRRNWKLDVAFRHETKDGIDRIGGAIANGPPGMGSGLVGGTTAALLPEPIDYTTKLVDATLQYAKGKGRFEVAYNMSLFDNGEHSLTWEDPFAPGTGTFGRQSLEPDNQYHQLAFTGSYMLPRRSQLTGFLSVGRMTQDQAFLPYTYVSGLGGTLQRNSFDGEVWQTTAKLALSSRPVSKLRLNASYRYDERDNDSPVNDYDYIVADSFNPAGTVQNRPLGYQRDRFDLMANYRIKTGMSLRGGYRYDAMSRDYQDVEREDTDEHTLFAKWKVRPNAMVNMSLHAEAGFRDGSNYQPPAGENPALRKFHLADRDRTRAGVSMNVMPTEQLDITASADYIDDDYDNSDIGLTGATMPTWTLDIAWQPRSDVTTSAWYTREDIESSQAGREDVTGNLAIPDWTADFDDTVDSMGVGTRITGIRSKWDVGADVVYTRTTGEVELVNLAGAVTPYPDLETSLTSVKLWTQYRYRKDMSWKLGYRYERYSADNWALDNLQADSVANLLLLDEDTADYDVHVIAASMIFHF